VLYLEKIFFSVCDNTAKIVISCAYCERILDDFNTYKFDSKIFHNKKTYGDKLLCGQGGCQRDFTRFQTLTAHIESAHYSVAVWLILAIP
jgi:hypothetical protein